MIKYNHPYFEKHYPNPDYKQEEKYIKDGYIWKGECLKKETEWGGIVCTKVVLKVKHLILHLLKLIRITKTMI